MTTESDIRGPVSLAEAVRLGILPISLDAARKAAHRERWQPAGVSGSTYLYDVEALRGYQRERAARLPSGPPVPVAASDQEGRPADNPPPGPEWKPIPGFAHYEASHRGLVRSIDRVVRGRSYPGTVLRVRPNNGGYLIVNLTDDGGARQTKTVHTLVLLAHAGPPPPGQETLHGPGGQTDNRWPENITYGTHEQNVAERVAAQPPKAPKPPPRPCLNHGRCGGYVSRGGRRCHECVVQLGHDGAELLWSGVLLEQAAEMLHYSSAVGLHTLAVKYGGYGQRPGAAVHAAPPLPADTQGEQSPPVGPLRRVRQRWAAWLADDDSQ